MKMNVWFAMRVQNCLQTFEVSSCLISIIKNLTVGLLNIRLTPSLKIDKSFFGIDKTQTNYQFNNNYFIFLYLFENLLKYKIKKI